MGASVLKSLCFLMLSVVLKEIYIPFLYKLCIFRSSGLKQHYSVLDKEGDFAKPYGTITKGLCSVP